MERLVTRNVYVYARNELQFASGYAIATLCLDHNIISVFHLTPNIAAHRVRATDACVVIYCTQHLVIAWWVICGWQ